MDYFPTSAGSQFSYADSIPEPTIGRSARLSVVPLDAAHVSGGVSSVHDLRSDGFAEKTGSPLEQQEHPSDQSRTSGHGHRQLLLNIIWPTTAIVVPISLVSAVLIGLVCGYRVKTAPSLFQSVVPANNTADSAYVLVNYSATRLVFLASWLSSMAPLLASFVMVLWSLPTAQTMRMASIESQPSHLPTPYQLSLVVGLTLASTERLRQYLTYAMARSRPSIPPVLHKAAMILTLCVFLACGVFLADTALHFYTTTVSFSNYLVQNQPIHSFSHGLSDRCLDWNRSDVFCYPCSVTLWQTPAQEVQAVAAVGEQFLLQHNNSQISEIRFVQDVSLKNADLAVLVPQTPNVPLQVDYRGSTIGVATQCSLITEDCNPRRVGESGLDTQFNCSDAFYGVLGLQPLLSDSGDNLSQTVDPNVPPLNWKPFMSLQYGYYWDSELTNPYDTGVFNASNGEMLSTAYPTCVPDAELINPVYVGLAGRFDDTFQSSTNNLSVEDPTGFLHGWDTYIDFVLSCSYTTYDVNYTWIDGSIQDTSYVLSPNGTLAEIFHGNQMYSMLAGGAHDLAINMQQAAQRGTVDDFLHEWSNLYSVKVLSTIGAYSAERPNLQEQLRDDMLVARVPKAALWALIACSLAYVVLAFALGFAALSSSSANVRDLAARLSLAGLTAAAFEEKDGTGNHTRIINNADNTFSKAEDGTRRVGVEGLAQTGYILSPVVSSQPSPLDSRSASSRYLARRPQTQVDFIQ